MSKNFILAALLGGLALPTLAQRNATPGVDQHQANQERRIEQGVNSGALSPREARRLEHRQGRIDRMEANAKADGVVSAKERGHLRAAEHRENRRIFRQKHDVQHDHNHDGRVDRPGRR